MKPKEKGKPKMIKPFKMPEPRNYRADNVEELEKIVVPGVVFTCYEGGTVADFVDEEGRSGILHASYNFYELYDWLEDNGWLEPAGAQS